MALKLLIDHPAAVRKVIAFEPAAMHFHPNGQPWIDSFREMYELYRRSGTLPALATFRERTFAEVDHPVMARATNPKNNPYAFANALYWFERELREYTSVELDCDGLLARAECLVPDVGRASRGYPTYEVGVELGRRLGRDVLELPGGHVGHVMEAAEFARGLAPSTS